MNYTLWNLNIYTKSKKLQDDNQKTTISARWSCHTQTRVCTFHIPCSASQPDFKEIKHNAWRRPLVDTQMYRKIRILIHTIQNKKKNVLCFRPHSAFLSDVSIHKLTNERTTFLKLYLDIHSSTQLSWKHLQRKFKGFSELRTPVTGPIQINFSLIILD
jgi:hypothetical protein